MNTSHAKAISKIADFVVGSAPSAAARKRAATAVFDTVGVMLAGAGEPPARIVQALAKEEGGHACHILGTCEAASASWAAAANGTAGHALDYDDMCFVSLAHPSAPLVAATLAVAEVQRAPGRALLDGYVVGFELEARLGEVMNPRHYQRGWHSTSTLGTIGAAAAASRILGLDAAAAQHALAIAASQASGVKENFGTMVKPLHAGLAARSGVISALLARHGMTASDRALDGPQGFLAAMDSEQKTLDDAVQDLGIRWEILETGITVKLYPSCAATHPSIDALLDLTRREALTADQVETIEITVDSITPTVLIYERPTTGLQGKFSMPFCAAAAVVHGRVGVDTFNIEGIQDPQVIELMARVTMRVNPALDGMAPPLTQADISVRLRDGRLLTHSARGARGYPERPAKDDELTAKFIACALRSIPRPKADQAVMMLRQIDTLPDIRALADLLQPTVGAARLDECRT